MTHSRPLIFPFPFTHFLYQPSYSFPSFYPSFPFISSNSLLPSFVPLPFLSHHLVHASSSSLHSIILLILTHHFIHAPSFPINFYTPLPFPFIPSTPLPCSHHYIQFPSLPFNPSTSLPYSHQLHSIPINITSPIHIPFNFPSLPFLPH